MSFELSNDLGKRLHEALLLVQRRNRRVRLSFKSDLSAVDSITLSIIMSIAAPTPSSLSRCLNLPAPRISRLVAHLADRGLIKSERSVGDMRSRILVFTSVGERAAREAEVVNWKVIRILLAGLSLQEQSDLLEIFTALADDLCPFALEGRNIATAISRLTVGLGILNDNYGETGMPLARFQILFDLWRAGGEISFKALAINFPLSPSTLSRECDHLELQGLLNKKVSTSDRRGTSIVITPEGSRTFLEHHSRIGARLARAIGLVEPSLKDRGMAVLAKLAYEPTEKLSLTPPVCIACNSVKLRHRARGFLVEELVRSRQHLALESELIPPKHECFLVSAGESVRALIEFGRPIGKVRPLKRVICDGAFESGQLRHILSGLAQQRAIEPQSSKTAQIIPFSLYDDVLMALQQPGPKRRRRKTL